MPGSEEYVLRFTADTSQMQSSLRGFAGNAKQLLQDIQAVASRDITINVREAANLRQGVVSPGLSGQLRSIRTETTGAALAGGASQVQAQRLGQQALNQAVRELAAQTGLTSAEQALLQRTVELSTQVQRRSALAAESLAVRQQAAADALARDIAREQSATERAIQARAQRTLAEQRFADDVRAQVARSRGVGTNEDLSARVDRQLAERQEADLIRRRVAQEEAGAASTVRSRAERVAAENQLSEVVREQVAAERARNTQSIEREARTRTLEEQRAAQVQRSVAEQRLGDEQAAQVRAAIASARAREADIVQQLVAQEAISSEETIQAKVQRAQAERDVSQRVRQTVAEELAASDASVAAKAASVAAERQAAEQVRLSVAQQQAADGNYIRTRSERIAAEQIANDQARLSAARLRATDEVSQRARVEAAVNAQLEARELRRLARETGELAGLRRSEVNQAVARVAGGAGGVFGPGGSGVRNFLGTGFRNVARFAIPSALLFGATSGISRLVESAEELEQINVRLQAQFENIGQAGAFDSLIEGLGATADSANRAAVASSQLDTFRDSLQEISLETGVASEEVFKLGGSFVGLFASLDGVNDALVDFSTEATSVASQFAVITGLAPEEAFNDLVGAVRAFAEDGEDVNNLLQQLTDDLVSVSDVSGIAADQLADFSGRIAPVAATAGFVSEEINAIGAALIQASGIGGAQLAEQFGRIISTFGEGLDQELADIAIQVPDLNLDLEDIFGGNTRDVLFQLIEGFDKLTEAQQRQIISSIGSRREGNTLATLLQNSTAVFAALEEQQNNAGVAAERFATVSETLTVRFNQLKAQFQLLGRELLENGLGDLIQDLISVASIFAEVIGTALRPALQGISAVLGVVPPEVLALAAAFAIGNRGVRTLAESLNGIQLAFRSTGIVGGLQTIGTRAAGAATGLTTLAGAGSALTGVLGVAGVALTGYSAIKSILAQRTKEAAENLDTFNDAMRDAGVEYVTLADRAKEYEETLLRQIELQNEVARTAPGADPTSIEASGAGVGLRGLALERDDLDEVVGLFESASLSADEFAAELIRIQSAGTDLGRVFTQLTTNPQNRDRIFSSLLGEDPSNERRALIDALSRFVESDELSQGQIADVLDTLADAAAAGITSVSEAADQFQNNLQLVKDLDDVTQSQVDAINELIDNRVDTPEGNLDFIAAARELLPDDFLDQAADAASDEVRAIREEIALTLSDLDLVRAQLAAGVITQEEFTAAADEVVAGLREQLAAAVATDKIEQIVLRLEALDEVEKQFAEIAVERFESDQRIAELLGQEIGTVDQLTGLAVDPRIQRDNESFIDAVEQLVDAERTLAIEAAGRAGSAEEARAILDSFSLSDQTGDLFVEQQLRAEQPLVERILGLEGQTEDIIDGIFESLAEDLNSGVGLRTALRAVLESQLADLENLLGQVDNPEAEAAVVQEIIAIRGRIGELASASLPDIALGADVGIDADTIADTVDSLNDQYELILQGIENDAQILSAFGIDQRPEALASQAAQLTALLADPDFTDRQARFDVAVQLAGVLQAIASLEDEELIAAQQALELLTGAADPEQLVRTEAIFAAISNQANAFNRFLNTYLDVGEETLNSMLQAVAELVAQGESVTNALAKAAQASADILRRRISTLQGELLGLALTGGSNDDILATKEEIDVLTKELESIAANQFRGTFGNAPDIPEITIGGVSVPDVRPAGGGVTGPTAEDTAAAAAQLADAQFELLRAQFALDPVALARISQREAASALARATTEADRIRAQAARINADREFAQAIEDVFGAQTELAITLAEIAGNTEEVLQLGVDQAIRELEFLQNQGAGEAAIAGAEARLAEARERQFEGLIQDQLGDLDFLFKIGDLTTQQYIAQLEALLAGLDPIADQELYRDIVLQIQDLRNRTNDLSFNLGNLFVPSLFEVRRLATTGFGGTPDQFAAQSVDNRNISIQINLVEGGNLQDVVDVLNDAVGTGRTSIDYRRY